MHNLSCAGCSLQTPFGLEDGQTVTFRFAGHIILAGEVIWERGHTTGVQFREPLHEAMVAHISNNPTSSSAKFLHDRFGRPVEGRMRRNFPLHFA